LELDGIVHALPRLVLVHRKLQGLEISSRSNYPNLDRSTGGAGDGIEVYFFNYFLSFYTCFNFDQQWSDIKYGTMTLRIKSLIVISSRI
jgi:hypothetical protein